MSNLKKCLAVLLAICFFLNFLGAEATAAEKGFAAEEFRRGVQSYHRGSYNEAILLFEKALAYVPNDSQILDWLGRSYYQSGIEGAAIQYWEDALNNDYQGDKLLLENLIALVKERRVTGEDIEIESQFIEAGSFPGKDGNQFYYSQPISALSLSDGSCFITAYGSNEILRFDANGKMIERIRGPANGFDRPMDIIKRADGNILVAEYAGDRVSVLSPEGQYISSFGKKGRGVGELLGPQYLDVDTSNNVYVSDFGNSRIVVFDNDGNGLFAFGESTPLFTGLKAPTGVAFVNEAIYVADAVSGTIYMFDTAGNYLDYLVPAGTFKQPEALKHWGDYLLVSDSNSVYAVDLTSGAVTQVSNTGNAPSRITCAIPDANGNLLVADFKTNEVYVMSKMSELVGGLLVKVDSINAESFPNVVMDIHVENRERQSVVGLSDGNFLITENKVPVKNQLLKGVANNNEVCDIAIVIDRSISITNYKETLQSAVRDIASAMNGKGNLHIISAGSVPILEMSSNPQSMMTFSPNQLKSPVTDQAAVDLGIRLAVNKLIPGEKKRAVIYITAGNSVSETFNSYGLADLSAFMNNNFVSFSVVNLSHEYLNSEISFLLDQTTGEEYYIYRPDGIAMIIDDILSIPNGCYQLSFTSSLKTDFGRNFLPVEVETYLLNRSGRTESGYFAPLE